MLRCCLSVAHMRTSATDDRSGSKRFIQRCQYECSDYTQMAPGHVGQAAPYVLFNSNAVASDLGFQKRLRRGSAFEYRIDDNVKTSGLTHWSPVITFIPILILQPSWHRKHIRYLPTNWWRFASHSAVSVIGTLTGRHSMSSLQPPSRSPARWSVRQRVAGVGRDRKKAVEEVTAEQIGR